MQSSGNGEPNAAGTAGDEYAAGLWNIVHLLLVTLSAKSIKIEGREEGVFPRCAKLNMGCKQVRIRL